MHQRRSRRILAALLAACHLLSCAAPALANPEGGSVVHGSAAIESRPGVTTITQQTDRAIINWNSFSNSAGEAIHFQQPAATSVTLNRVVGVDPSLIQGSLTANGRLFLINPNGIVFGPDARVDVGGIVASTLSISDDDFKNGNYTLVQDPAKALRAVINKGTITAKPGGFVALVAPIVNNQGKIVAAVGRVSLAAGTKAVINPDGHGLVNLQVETGARGDVSMREEDASSLLKQAVNNTHIVDSGKVEVENGRVFLRGASGLAMNEGEVRVDGGPGQTAGAARIEGASTTILAPGSVISANGVGGGAKGGEVRAISRDTTIFAPKARLEARGGGGEGGDGGLVEVSGHQRITLEGAVDVSAAEGGRGGTYYIDPADLRITNLPAAGNLDGNLPDVFFGDNGVSFNEVSRGAIEALPQGSFILLEADNTISLDGGASITLSLNSTLDLHTRFGNINTTGGTITASGTGGITINAGDTSGGSGSATLGTLIADSGAINITVGRGQPDGVGGSASFVSLQSSGTVQIRAGNVTMGTASGATVTVDALGSITDGNGATANVNRDADGSVSFTATGAIGASTDRLEVNAAVLTASATNGGVFIQEGGGIVVDAVSAGGASSDVVIQSSGNITLRNGVISAGRDVHIISTGGAVNDDGDAGANDITAVSLFITAATGIGNVDIPDTNVTNATLSSTGANTLVRIEDLGGLASLSVTSNISSFGTGTVQVSGGTPFTIDGAGTINSSGITTLSYTNTPAAAVTLGTVTIAGAGSFVLNVGGAVSGTASQLNVNAPNAFVTLIAGGAIQAPDGFVDIDAGAFSASTVSGNIFIAEQGGAGLDGANAGGGGAVTISTNGLLHLAAGTVSGSNVILESTGSGIVDSDTGVDVIATTATLIGGTGVGQSTDRIETTVGTLNITAGGAGAFITESDGVALGTASMNISVAGGGLTLTAGGAITDANGASANLVHASGLGPTLSLVAGGAIGSVGDPIETQSLTIAASTTNGGIFFHEDNTTELLTVTAGGAGSDVSVLVSLGNLILKGAGVTAGRDVFLTANSGSILDDADAGVDVTGGSANLVSSTGSIGSSGDPLETSLGTLNLVESVTGVFLTESNGVTLQNVSATGTGADVNIATTTGGLVVRTITANDRVDLTASGGAITDGDGGAALNVTANNLVMNAGGAIADGADPLEIDTNFLTAITTDGAVFLTEADGTDIDVVTAGGTARNVVLTTTTGGFGVGTITAQDDTIFLIALGGTVTDTGPVGDDLVAATANIDAGTFSDIENGLETQLTNLVVRTRDLNGTVRVNELDTFTSLTVQVNVSDFSVGEVSITGGTPLTLTHTGGGVGRLDASSSVATSLSYTNDAGATLSLGTVSLTGGGLTLDVPGAVIDGNGAPANLVHAGGAAPTLAITAGGAIGTLADAIETQASTIAASTTNGGIFLRDNDTVDLLTVSAGGAGSDVDVTVDAGNLNLTTGVVSAVRDVYLTASAGAINDDSDGLANDISAFSAFLVAPGGIGNADALETSVINAALTATGANSSIRITDAGLATLTVNANIASYGAATVQVLGGSEFRIDGSGVLTATDAGGGKSYTNTGSAALLLGGVAASSLTIQNVGSILDGNGAGIDVTAGTATLNASAGSVGTALDPIDTTVGTLNATAGATGVFVTESDGVAIGAIVASGGTVDVRAFGGPITDGDAGVDVTAATAVLHGSGGIGANGDPLEVLVSSLTTLTSGLNASTYVADSDGLGTIAATVNIADFTLGTVQITGPDSFRIDGTGVLSATGTGTYTYVQTSAAAPALKIGSIAGNSVDLTNAAGFADANAGLAAGTSNTLILRSTNGSIGTLLDPVEVRTGNLTALVSASGSIFVNEADGATLGSISAAGAGADVSVSATAGNLAVGTVSAPDQVTIAANGGAITDANAGAANLTGAQITLTARDAIAANVDPLETQAASLSASTAGTVGASSINVANTGSLSVTSITAGGTGSNVQVEVLGGSLSVGTITAAGDLVELVASAGGITDANAGAANITAGQLILTARDAIATNVDPLETQVGSLSASTAGTVGASPINVANTGSLNATSITAGGTGSNVQIEVLAGDLSVGGITAAGDFVELVASAGAITDANAATDNITANQTTLTARDGIGAGDALEVLVNVLATLTTGANASTAVSDADGLASLSITTNRVSAGTVTIGGAHTLAISGTGVLTGSAAPVPVSVNNTGGGLALGGIAAASLTLVTLGAVTDGNGAGADVTTGALTITAGGAVGTALDAIDTTVATLDATAGGAGLFVLESDGLSIGAIVASGATVDVRTTAGALADGDAAVDVTAATAVLSAPGGIGSGADPFEVLVSSLTTITTGANASTHVADADGLAVLNATANIASFGLGTVQITGAHTLGIDGSGVVTVAAAPTAVSLSNTGAGLALGALTASSVTLSAAGAVTDANGGSGNVVAGALSITSAGAIGTAGDPLETQVTSIAASTTSGGVFVAEADGVTLASIVAGGAAADVTVSTAAGGLTVGSVDAAGDVLTLSAPAGAIADDGEAGVDLTAATATLSAGTGIGAAGDPLEALFGVLTTTTTGANASMHLTDADGFTSLTITSNIANYGTGTVQVGGAHTVTLSGGGVLAVSAAPAAFSFRNTAAGTDLALGSVSAASAALRAEGSILDGNGASANLAGTSVTFTAGGSVGTQADPVETDVASVNAATTNGGVFLNEDDGATLVSVVAGGTGANVQVVSSTGDLTLGSVTAAGDDITLAASAGRIVDDGEAAADVTARTASLSAPGGIGTGADPVEVLVDDLNLTADALNSSIFVSDADGLNNLTISVNIGDFGVAGVQIGGADMLATGPDGSLTSNAPGTIVTFNNVLTSADLVLGVVTGTDVMINSVGAIFDGNGDAPNVIADTAIIQSIGDVGTPGDPIEIQVNELTATVTGGGLFVEDVDGLTVSSVVVTGAGSNVEINALAGDITVGNISTEGGAVVLVANAGGVLDDGEAGVDITARSAVFVTADGVGTAADPLDVSVSELGVLSTAANGRIAISDPDGFTAVALDVNLADFAAGGIAISGPGNLATTPDGHLGGTLVGTDLALVNRAAGADFLLDSLTVRDAQVVTEGSILDGNGGVLNLTGRNVVIDIAGTIGTGLDALETSIDRIDARTFDGGVHVNELSGLKIGVIEAGGAGRDVTVEVDAGNLELGRAFALDDRVALTANGGSLLDDELDVPDVAARRVDLLASGSIGTGLDGIETEADVLTAVALGGSVVIREADGVELVEARATDDVIVLTEAGGIALGLVEARDDILLRTPGSILDANSDALNIDGDVATLEAGGSIGTAADKLETRLTEIDAATQAGEVAFAEEDGINLRDVVVGGGFELDASAGGDVGLGSVVVDAGVTIDAGGSIVATAEGQNLVSTTGEVKLEAGGVIGTTDAPIDAQVAGSVAVQIGSAAPDGRSSAFTPSLARNQLVKLNDPPGKVEIGELDVEFENISMDVSMTQPQTVFRSFATLAVIALPAPPPPSLVPGVVILDGGVRGMDGGVTTSSQPFTLALGEDGAPQDPAVSTGLSSAGAPTTAPGGAKAKTAKSLGEYRAGR